MIKQLGVRITDLFTGECFDEYFETGAQSRRGLYIIRNSRCSFQIIPPWQLEISDDYDFLSIIDGLYPWESWDIEIFSLNGEMLPCREWIEDAIDGIEDR